MQFSRRRRDGGFVLVAMLASMVVVLTVVGLAIDTGHLQLVKVRMQTAADAAAVGAVQEMKASGAARLAEAAKGDTAANGFADGQNSVTVAVHNPPASGYYASDNTAVEVTIHQSVGTFFMALLGFNSMDVNARAVARRGPGTDCLYVLDGSASSALSMSGGAVAQLSCGVVVNSTSASALALSGGAQLSATAVSVAGNYSATGGATVSPAPAVHVGTEPDPLGYVAAPAAGACDQTGFAVSNGQAVTISPGVYCNGISVSGGARLTLNSGTYVLKGGGFTVTGMSTVSGAGVTFYNTAGGGFGYGAISLSGGASIRLSAPTEGPLAGILFFQDRSVVGGAGSSISGGANSTFDGALYFPTTPLSYSGGTATAYTIIVARQVIFTGGTTLNSDYSSLTNGTPVKGNAALSE